MNNEIKVFLPQKFDLVKGDLFQLFYRGVVDAPDPFVYDILSVCEKGRNFPRYFEFLPEDEGEFELEIYVYGAGKELLGKGKTILKVTDSKPAEKNVNILCIGDSLTAGGEWVGEAKRRLTENGGEPFGVGFDGINFVGNCNKNGASFEAFGGWKWESFYSCVHSSMWIECEHDKTAVDQHSLWEDERGSLWVLETIEKERLKFNRAYLHAEPVPESGVLKCFGYATNTSPIKIKKSFEEQNSPFINPETNEADIRWYLDKNNIDNLDLVYILLGTNGWKSEPHEGLTDEEYVKLHADNGRKLADLIHEASPNAKIKVLGLIGCSVNGGTGTSYGARLPYCDDYGYMHFTMLLNKAYEEWTNEEKYKDFMEFVNLSGQIDADHAFPCEEKRVNTRSTATETIGTNGAHPSYEGYMQIADAAWRNMVASLKK
ncbi:MAG: SGNH/GDSL hydrolase family protein [Clostridia bacterium]|nr:SGNH/GDSL hydrolase family protein [Clostridia bacterium]